MSPARPRVHTLDAVAHSPTLGNAPRDAVPLLQPHEHARREAPARAPETQLRDGVRTLTAISASADGVQRLPRSIHIWHNLLWSNYKGEMFSALWNLTDGQEFALRFTQIAETERGRSLLAAVDRAHHRYPYDLLFAGRYSDIPLRRRLLAVLLNTLRSDADLFVLSGYHRPDYWLQLIVLKARRKKIAVFLDSTANDQPRRLLRDVLKRRFLRAVDGVFGYGERTRQYAVSLGARRDRVFTPCLTAALPGDYSPERAIEARLRTDFRAEAPRYLFIGRFCAEKGLDLLLAAFAVVRERYPLATLRLVGDGQLRAALESSAQSLIASGAVSFVGSKSGDELFSEYTRASVFVLPSRSEPWGLVVNEAFAYGCPVIVSDVCGCVPELVFDGVTGLVHRRGDADNLAQKMLLAPALFADIAQVAQRCQDVALRYTPERAAHNVLEGCRQLLQ